MVAPQAFELRQLNVHVYIILVYPHNVNTRPCMHAIIYFALKIAGKEYLRAVRNFLPA